MDDDTQRWDRIQEAIEEFLELEELREEIRREEALEWMDEMTSEWLN